MLDNAIANASILEEVQKLEVIPTLSCARSFNRASHRLSSMQVATTVQALQEERPAVPTVISEIVGQYMSSRDWLEAGARLTL